ncbi:MAG: SCO family protein [Acidimicrobiia bacterium]
MLDQDGRSLFFYTDLVRGKVVAINFIYTTCRISCSAQGRTFSNLQTLLGDRLGNNVYLISVTTDPEMDTPARLRTWGEQFGRRPGWTLVTGTRANIHTLLRGLTGSTLRQQRDSPTVLFRHDLRGIWKSDFALAAPARMHRVLTTW